MDKYLVKCTRSTWIWMIVISLTGMSILRNMSSISRVDLSAVFNTSYDGNAIIIGYDDKDGGNRNRYQNSSSSSNSSSNSSNNNSHTDYEHDHGRSSNIIKDHNHRDIQQKRQRHEEGQHQETNTTIKTSKPYFILHVGPPKTATTTIQCGLEQYSMELAQLDNYYYLGKRCNSLGNGNMMPNGEQGIKGNSFLYSIKYNNTNTSGYLQIKGRMDDHYSQGHNVIYSLEALSSKLTDLDDEEETDGHTSTATKLSSTRSKRYIWDILDSLFDDWNVQIVIAYRHYFQWLPSLYYQQHVGPRYQVWPHERNKRTGGNFGTHHPSYLNFLAFHLRNMNQGEISSLFNQSIANHINDVDSNLTNNSNNNDIVDETFVPWSCQNDPTGSGKHLSSVTYKSWSQHFNKNNVHVLNLHSRQPSSNPFINFICTMLPTSSSLSSLSSPRDRIGNGSGEGSSTRMNHHFESTNNLCRRLLSEELQERSSNSSSDGNNSNNDDENENETEPKKQTKDLTTMRTSQSFDADRIAEAAYDTFIRNQQKNLDGEKSTTTTKTTSPTTIEKIPTKKSLIKKIINEMERTNFHSKSNIAIFQRCISSSMQKQLLRSSIYFENQLYHMMNEKKHNDNNNKTTTTTTTLELPQSVISEHELLFEEYTKITKLIKSMISTTNTTANINNTDSTSTTTTTTTITTNDVVVSDSIERLYGYICEVDPLKVLSNQHWYTFLQKQMIGI